MFMYVPRFRSCKHACTTQAQLANNLFARIWRKQLDQLASGAEAIRAYEGRAVSFLAVDETQDLLPRQLDVLACLCSRYTRTRARTHTHTCTRTHAHTLIPQVRALISYGISRRRSAMSLDDVWSGRCLFEPCCDMYGGTCQIRSRRLAFEGLLPSNALVN